MAIQNSHPEDYISLPGIKQIIRNFFKGLFDFIAFVFRALRRNLGILLLIIACSLVAGYSYYFVQPPVYKYDMLVEFNGVTRKAYFQIFDQLNTMLGQSGAEALAKELNIDKKVTSNILSFDVRGLDGQSLANDTLSKPEGLIKISVELQAPTQPDSLQQAIVNYVNARPYIKTMKEGQMEVYRARMSFINSEQAKLDSLKEAYNRFLASGRVPTTIYNNAFDPADIYTRSGELSMQRADLVRWISREGHAMSPVDGFKQINYPVYRSMSKPLITAGMAGILAGLALCLLIQIKKEL